MRLSACLLVAPATGEQTVRHSRKRSLYCQRLITMPHLRPFYFSFGPLYRARLHSVQVWVDNEDPERFTKRAVAYTASWFLHSAQGTHADGPAALKMKQRRRDNIIKCQRELVRRSAARFTIVTRQPDVGERDLRSPKHGGLPMWDL